MSTKDRLDKSMWRNWHFEYDLSECSTVENASVISGCVQVVPSYHCKWGNVVSGPFHKYKTDTLQGIKQEEYF